MTGSRLRLILAVLAGVLAITVAVVLVNRLVLRAEWWQVRHRTTPVPAVPLAGIGPPAGPLTGTWQRATGVHRSRMSAYDQVAHEVLQGQVVVASGRGVAAYDARTGGERWSYSRKGWVLLGWSVTRDHLVAYLERDGDRGDRLLLGFDAVSGGLLWRRPGGLPAGIARATLRWPAGADVVLTTEDGRRSVSGRSAATGNRLWTARLPAGCRLPESAAYGSDGDEELSALTVECVRTGARAPDGIAPVPEQRVLAMDPRTGRIRWSKALGSAGPPRVAVRGEVAAISDGTELRAYDRAGKELIMRSAEDMCGDGMCPVTISGNRLILVYQADQRGAGRRMEAIDMATGRTAWRRDAPGYAALTAAGDHLYALRPRVAANLLPAGVDIIDPANGSAAEIPAPFAMEQGVDGAQPWLAAAGGLLYAAVPEASPQPTGAARLVALRGAAGGPGPMELGGVEVADWPDACGLFKKADLAAARLTDYIARPDRAEVGGVRLPHPVSCTYEEGTAGRPAGDGAKQEDDQGADDAPRPSASAGPAEPGLGPEDARGLTVSLKWVAESGDAAAGLLAALRATQSQVRQRTDIGGDEAYELGPTAGTIALRVDRYVITVNASSPPGAATRLARVIASRLDGGP